MFRAVASILLALAVFAITPLLLVPAKADLRTPAPPGWWDPDGVGAGADWHYRVPVTLPASSSVNSTATVDVNFVTLATQMNGSGTFDINSVRVVRPGGTLATTQEYNDTRFGGGTDASGNNRGEVRWIVEDGGTQTYYIYFDITQNGAKSASTQAMINGNFEHSSTGQEDPSGWDGNRTDLTYDAQVRPSETVTVTDATTASTDGSPNSGSFSYLAGARTNADTANGEIVTLTRTIAVPATNAGNLNLRWKPQGWDSSDNGQTTFDFMRVEIVGSTTTEIIGPTAGNYATRPFAPNMVVSPISASSPGYGQYNRWDMDTNGTHYAGMTVGPGATPWWSYSQSLSAWAGQTVTLRFSFNYTSDFRSWFLIDDVEWSLVTGTLGTAEAFGAAVTSLAGTPTYPPGQMLTITAQVDARPTAATTPVTANVYDSGGTAVASGIILFNDGTHGDAVAGDAIWTNNGSIPAQPTYTIPLATANSSGWTVRVFAKDASTSLSGATNDGLLRRNGQPAPQIEANYWNIDEANFNVAGATLSVTKTSTVVSDGVSASNPKSVPGATVRYCIVISNAGTATANLLAGSDPIPSNLVFQSGTIRSGSSCATATTVEDDDASGADESDPQGGAIAGSTLNFSATSLANGANIAFTFLATIN